jgi:uncharacterized protein (DUF433 family)
VRHGLLPLSRSLGPERGRRGRPLFRAVGPDPPDKILAEVLAMEEDIAIRARKLRAMLKQRRAMTFTRITVDPAQMGGVPCIRGLRIPVATVVAMLADGMTQAEILAAYPDLVADDIREALRYAADAVRERELPLAGP